MDKITIIEERGKECNFNYNKDEGKLTITLAGFLTMNDGAEEFIKKYIDVCSKLNKGDTILIIDSTELRVFEQHFTDELERLFRDYSLFKKIYCIKSKYTITNNQVKRLLRKLEIKDKFIFIDFILEIE